MFFFQQLYRLIIYLFKFGKQSSHLFWRVANSSCHLFLLWLLCCVYLSHPFVLGAWCGSDCISSWILLYTFPRDSKLTSKHPSLNESLVFDSFKFYCIGWYCAVQKCEAFKHFGFFVFLFYHLCKTRLIFSLYISVNWKYTWRKTFKLSDGNESDRAII